VVNNDYRISAETGILGRLRGRDSALDDDFKFACQGAGGAHGLADRTPVAIIGLNNGNNVANHNEGLAGAYFNTQPALIAFLPVN
jgi:hypothetical protein